jgi:hypothetical protein
MNSLHLWGGWGEGLCAPFIMRGLLPWRTTVRVVFLAQAGLFTSTAHALPWGVQPQGEQDARVNRHMAGRAATRLDGLEPFAQVLAFDGLHAHFCLVASRFLLALRLCGVRIR